MSPMKNPPTTDQPLTTFSGWTEDFNENKIEEWSGVEYETTLPGEFNVESFVNIVDTGDDDTMVS
jgi:hypothetical protein